ncbi:MAG TPA: hypothetical protein VM532_17135 [Burkholderiales bacterium]|nr:hypothetical protein [Burkholderiales bacterium]
MNDGNEGTGRTVRHRRNTSVVTVDIERDPDLLNAATRARDLESGLPLGLTFSRQDTLASLNVPPSPLSPSSPSSPFGSTTSLVPLIPHGQVVDIATPPTPEQQRQFTHDTGKAVAFVLQEFSKGFVATGASLAAGKSVSKWGGILLEKGIEAAMKDGEWQKAVGVYSYGAVTTLVAATAIFSWATKHTKPLVDVIGKHEVPQDTINKISLGIASTLFLGTVGMYTAYGALQKELVASSFAFLSEVGVATGVREAAIELFKNKGIKSAPVITNGDGEQTVVPVENTAERQAAININYQGLSALIAGLGAALVIHTKFNLGEQDPKEILGQAVVVLGVLSAALEGADEVNEIYTDRGINVFRKNFFTEDAKPGFTDFTLKSGEDFNTARFLDRWKKRFVVNAMILPVFDRLLSHHAYGVYAAVLLTALVAGPLTRAVRTFANLGADLYEKRYPAQARIPHPRPNSHLDNDMELNVLSTEVARAQQVSVPTRQQPLQLPSGPSVGAVTTGLSGMQLDAPATGPDRSSTVSVSDVYAAYFEEQFGDEIQQSQQSQSSQGPDVQANMMIMPDYSDVTANVFRDLEAKGVYGAPPSPERPVGIPPAIIPKDLAEISKAPSDVIRTIKQSAHELMSQGAAPTDEVVKRHYQAKGVTVGELPPGGLPVKMMVTAQSQTNAIYAEVPTAGGRQVVRIPADIRPPGIPVTIAQVLQPEIHKYVNERLKQVSGQIAAPTTPPTDDKASKHRR